MFGLSTPRRFASYYRPFDRERAEEGITEALADLIEQAGIAIERFRNLDLTLAPSITQSTTTNAASSVA